MFEHVGAARYDEFFGRMNDLLTPDGVMLLHSIGRMSPPGTTGPWIRKYIFPGGYTPSMSEVFAATERQRLWVTDVEILRLHYAETLKHWAGRFQANRERVRQLYDERFCRMWEFYLACAEMVFRAGSGMVFQMQLTRHRQAVPQTRDYMVHAERVLRSREDPATVARAA
jgi:cyclopropane-fatty-acyl-phospholipid synthase